MPPGSSSNYRGDRRGYASGTDSESHCRKHVAEGSLRGQWLPGSRSSARIWGDSGARWPPLVAFTAALAACPKKRAVWTLDIKAALLRLDSFTWDVFVRAPPDWDPRSRTRTWTPRVAAYGLNDAPAASFATRHKYLLGEDKRDTTGCLSFCASSHDPCLFS